MADGDEAERVVSCGRCALVLGDADRVGASRISDGVSSLVAYSCGRCGAQISVITRKPEVPDVDGEPFVSYKPPRRP